MGGCLPLLIQMPFLFAFYKVLDVSIEMRSASWFWVHDLSQPETYAIRILAHHPDCHGLHDAKDDARPPAAIPRSRK